jgi:NAD(P)H-hydrate epimerase
LAPGPESAALVAGLLRKLELPVIIDGGGLGVLKDKLGLLEESPSKSVILTPHLGEFQRLEQNPLPEKRSDLKPIAAQFAKAHKVTLVLKGQPTYVARPDGHIYENSTGNPGLATAGTGDVLSGVIAGIISQGVEPQAAAEAGVYLHGLAGDIAAAEKTEPGMVASDVIEAIPAALKQTLR